MGDVFEEAKESIRRREYQIGTLAKYKVLTIKNHNHHYLVILLDEDREIAEEHSNGRLEAAKRLGIRLLAELREDAGATNTSMVHYFKDRSGGKPWDKDNKTDLSKLFNEIKHDPFQNMNRSNLRRILQWFTNYREKNEQQNFDARTEL